MKAFVTGATGFIGQNLVNKLVNDCWGVSILIRSNRKTDSLSKLKVDIYKGDLNNLSFAQKKIRNVDVVFNLAGAFPHHHLADRAYWKTNVEGVKNLLEICKNSSIKRFVHISTVGIYGPTSLSGADENSPLLLKTTYAKTKALGERLVSEYHKKYSLPSVIIRPTIAFGPFDTRPGFSNLFPLIQRGLFIPVGNGRNHFHTVYVENLIEALLLAVTCNKAVGEDFIIGDDPCPTMREIINTICQVEKAKLLPVILPPNLAYTLGIFGDMLGSLGLPAPLTRQRVRFITEEKKFKIEKAKTLLGYKARIKLREGVERTYQWYKSQHYL